MRVEGVHVLRPKSGREYNVSAKRFDRWKMLPLIRFAIGSLVFKIFDDGGYPDGVEAHGLNVVEVVDDAVPCPAAIFSSICVARAALVVRSREPVGDNLYHG